MYGMHQTSHITCMYTCKMESDESEGIQDLPVTFELNLSDDMNTNEVISHINHI